MKSKQAIKNLVPDDIYTDRQDFLDYFYAAAINAVKRHTKSTVLLGQRRMGKTEIFKRVVNKLFLEQESQKIESVIPVYYSFKSDKMDRWEFAVDYAENFLRWYTAFKTDSPDIIKGAILQTDLIPYIRKNLIMTDGLEIALTQMKGLIEKKVTIPEQSALLMPRTLSDCDNTTIIMFLDEFQNIHLPQHEFRIIGYVQEAVESPTCPHFVTGSAMSILNNDILGKGALYGRFNSKPIKPFTDYYGSELAIKAALSYKIELSVEMALNVAKRCGGNPFYIDAVIHQSAEQNIPICSENDLNQILAVDLSSGFIWGELHDQVMKWITRINEIGITRWVLYLSATQETEKIEPEWIRDQLYKKEGKKVSIEVITDVLIKLSRGDLIEYMEFGGWFKKINDPILLDFLKVWGQTEIEGFDNEFIHSKIIKDYSSIVKKAKEYFAYIAEVYMAQILWNGQRKSFSGKYFHTKTKVIFPNRFVFIKHRVRLGASSGKEIDIYASAGNEFWICESKYWKKQKVGTKQIKEFIKLGEQVKEFEGEEHFKNNYPLKLRLWLYAHNGVTKPALDLINKHGILWSDREDLNALLEELGLRKLSDIK